MIQFASKLTLISDSGVFFGPGVRDLLEGIEKLKSVKEAAENMGLSYSKAWKMVKSVEKGLGKSVVLRVQGGKTGGSASLSEDGRILLRKYEEFEESGKRELERVFSSIFGA